MMRLPAAVTAGLAAALLASAATAAPSPDASDYVKRAGNFLKNCDARADASGKRPEPNYVCLAFMAGLVEGYTTAAIANGNPRPYCLPRPASLAELSDMLSTVIEQGVPPTLPTAAVFHFMLQENFKCPPQDAGDAGTSDGVEVAQAEPLLKVTPPAEVEAEEPKLPIVKPAGPAGRSSEPQLPIVAPSGAKGAQPLGDEVRRTTPAAPAAPAAPQPPAPVGEPTATPAAPVRTIPGAPAPAPTADVGAGSAVGPGTAVGTTADTDAGTAVANEPIGDVGSETAVGPRPARPVNKPQPYSGLPAPLQQQPALGAPQQPQTPQGQSGPQPPRSATGN